MPAETFRCHVTLTVQQPSLTLTPNPVGLQGPPGPAGSSSTSGLTFQLSDDHNHLILLEDNIPIKRLRLLTLPA